MPTAYQPRPGPPPTWPQQPGQRPPQSVSTGQSNFPGAVAPPPPMYNTSPPVPISSMTPDQAQFNAYNTSQYRGPAPPMQGGPRGHVPPPPVGIGQNQGQVAPQANQQPPLPVNPGPQTMMNMGFVSPSDSPTPAFPGNTGQMPVSSGQHQFMQPGQQQIGQQPPPGLNQPYNYPQRPIAGQPPASGPLPQPQPRRLDPDQMPSPVSNVSCLCGLLFLCQCT